MGLCKCPKKKVTNLFCFEHRVNVCEHCLVESHNKCVVQSYLSWLADSDYDTNCTLCSTPLECKETVRLKCLHLLHWECLDEWARRLPPNTAPAGYKCQQCHEGIFPSPNQTSPAIDRLRVMLQRANWARAGLGLSLLPELDNSPSVASFIPSITNPIMGDLNGQARLHEMNFSTGNGTLTAMVVDVVDEFTKHEEQNQFIARKLMSTNENDYMDTSPLLRSQDRDEDLPENKYKRRSASEWLSRWFRLRYGGRSVFDSRAQWKRGIFCVILSIVLVLTVFTVLLRVSVRSTDDDPVFSPLDNPNIRIALPEHSQ